MLIMPNFYYKNEALNVNKIDNVNTSNEPVKTEYDTIALVLIIAHFILIGTGVGVYFIVKKKKEKKKLEEGKNSSTSNQMVFYSSYDTQKTEEVKTETSSVFTSTSSFSTSSIVNGPTDSENKSN